MIVTCPVCQSEQTTPFTKVAKHGRLFKIVRCNRCLARVDERVADIDRSQNTIVQTIATGDHYTRSYSSSEFQERLITARHILDAFSPFMQDRGLLVEVGIGEGFLARAAGELFERVIGLDIDLRAALNAHEQYGSPANVSYLHHDTFVERNTDKVAVLAMWHVLEHLFDPIGTLAKLTSQLTKDGLIIGQVPLYREEYVFEEHFIFYNETSLAWIAARLGCYPIYLQRDESNGFLSFCFRKASKADVLSGFPTLEDNAVEFPRDALPSATFIVGFQRSGTNLLFEILSKNLPYLGFNENDPAAFEDFVLRPSQIVTSLITNSNRPCLFKSISETLRFESILEAYPGSKLLLIFRNPLEIIPSYVMEFGSNLKQLNHDIVYNFVWDRLKDVSARVTDWGNIESLLKSHSGRLRATDDLPSKIVLLWLLTHRILLDADIEGRENTHVICYDDIIGDMELSSLTLSKAVRQPVTISEKLGRDRERGFLSSQVDVDIALEALDVFMQLKRIAELHRSR